MRHYLTMRTGKIPRVSEIYEAFKDLALEQRAGGQSRDELVVELSKNASWFAAMAFGAEQDVTLATKFREIDQLATVTYLFLPCFTLITFQGCF